MSKIVSKEKHNKRSAGLHPKQIPTTQETIKRVCWHRGTEVIEQLVGCFLAEQGGNEYKNLVVAAAYALERISCLVYKKGEEYHKMTADQYRRYAFDSFAETPDEIQGHLRRITGQEFPLNDVNRIHKAICRIADIVCPMMASMAEQGFVGEYVYTIDYVIRHGESLPKPIMGPLYPTNYKDFHPFEGIGEEVRKYTVL